MSNITVGLFTKQTGWNVGEVHKYSDAAFQQMEATWNERNQLREQVMTLLNEVAKLQGTNGACEEIIARQGKELDSLRNLLYLDDDERWD